MKPNVVVLSLGGTIAMADKGGAGVAPGLTAEMLVAAVPQLAEVATVEAASFRQLPSPEIGFDDLFALAREITARLEGGARGVVVTQGTDTMEESAFVLDRIVAADGPVVITGAMRNPTMAGPDGPANLLNAVRVAVHEAARGIGAMVVMNDDIHAARYVQKSHTNSPAAFRSTPVGPIGWIAEGAPRILVRPAERYSIALPAAPGDASVALLRVALGDDGRLIDRVLEAGYGGLVLEATGGGHVPAAIADKLEQALRHIPVVFASRTGRGETQRRTYDFPGSEMDLLRRGLIGAGWLDGLKARLLLTLLLRAGADRETIGESFAAWLAPPAPR